MGQAELALFGRADLEARYPDCSRGAVVFAATHGCAPDNVDVNELNAWLNAKAKERFGLAYYGRTAGWEDLLDWLWGEA